MLHLSLLRHAKSSWDDPEHSDHERQLTKRGTKAARRIGRYITEQNLTPDLILCSDAIRARATLTFVLSVFDQPTPQTEITQALYLPPPGEILRIVKRKANGAKKIMVIGHNPGLHALALSLPATGRKSDLAALAIKYPTAALAHIEFDAENWADVLPASGTLAHFITPKALSA